MNQMVNYENKYAIEIIGETPRLLFVLSVRPNASVIMPIP